MLTKQGYYTVPPCDELDEMVEDGHCVVEGFTIGRRGFGEIHFPDKTDVYGMNLDLLGEQLTEIVLLPAWMNDIMHTHSLSLVLIDLKEVQVYPDDDNKPPVGQGLNKTAIVRLEGNWPVDKTSRELVTDPERIEKMGYVNKLKRSTSKIGGTFIDYFPDSGTCVFQVGVVCCHDSMMVHIYILGRLNISPSTSCPLMTTTQRERSKERKGVWSRNQRLCCRCASNIN